MEIKKAVLDKGQLVANKAKDLAEIAKLKSQIFSCEEVIRKNQLEIGNMVFTSGQIPLDPATGTMPEETWSTRTMRLGRKHGRAGTS